MSVAAPVGAAGNVPGSAGLWRGHQWITEGSGKHAWKKMLENPVGVRISNPLSAPRGARGVSITAGWCSWKGEICWWQISLSLRIRNGARAGS